MSSATDELCAMLDERGVEWRDTKIGKGFITVYEHDCITWIVTEHSSGRLSVKGCIKPTQGHYDGMTPAQAIGATLGRGDLERENAKLREELEQWHRLTANIELPEYPTCTFQPKDLERENAKLRELALGLYKCWLNEGCEGCPMQDDDGWCVRDILLRELGIVVSE